MDKEVNAADQEYHMAQPALNELKHQAAGNEIAAQAASSSAVFSSA